MLCACPGCILRLDGCCYIANLPLLIHNTTQQLEEQASVPLIIGFDGMTATYCEYEATKVMRGTDCSVLVHYCAKVVVSWQHLA